MNTFPLKIVTPDGIRFDGEARELVVRTTSGDTGIMAGHINYVAPLGMGQAMVDVDGQRRYGACIGGMVSVVGGVVTLVPTSFEWSDAIDIDRAKRSRDKAELILGDKNSTETDLVLAKARLSRALIRTAVADRFKK